MPADSAPRGSRLILITQAEFHALASAAAVHEVEGDFEPGDRGYAKHRREVAALSRVIRKWNAAGERPPVKHADRDLEVAARALEDLAAHDADWTARAYRPEEAETIVKMRKAILARAAAIRKGKKR